jgi:Na+-translocating ferredoxin:NAD+ oxidoreductase RnfD subunit
MKPEPAAPRAGDPRLYQIATLGALLFWGIARLGFDVTPERVAVVLAAALATQALGTRLARLPRFDPRSALISGLSLCLLLRTESIALAATAAALAVGSKFVLRWRGKHLFNPTNFALVVLLLTTREAWISPAQWGTATAFAFALAGAGGLVVHRAARGDTALAFLAFYGGLLLARSVYLGEPLAIPLHRLESGGLLLFAFFMITDPKTTPDSRVGRVVFAALVAGAAWWIQFHWFRTNGLLWSLAAASLVVPLLDRLFPGARFRWQSPGIGRAACPDAPPFVQPVPVLSEVPMSRHRFRRASARFVAGAVLLAAATSARPAAAFCGLYVAKADTKLWNEASKVVLVHDGDRTVVTLANDYQGDAKDFAMVIPVPTVLERGQIHVGDRAPIDHLDAYSSPRLVEYFDDDPCATRLMDGFRGRVAKEAVPAAPLARDDERRKSLGVTIEAQYTVGEYDIVILSAEQSNGLATWLRENGYRIPDGAADVLASYIRQNLKFFVAKVNLAEQKQLGVKFLRPLQIAYESPKFMLPIRLGTANARGQQELFVFALTRQGRVETTNYRTVKLPSGDEIPPYVKDRFSDFYRTMFRHQVERQDTSAVFTEYAWDMAWCDPCAAEPLNTQELRSLGVFWLAEDASSTAPSQVFVTRLHVRYDKAHFPEDLVFQQTGDRENFQGRYVLRHAFEGSASCTAATAYRKELRARQEREVQTLAALTGWEAEAIRRDAHLAVLVTKPASWWSKLWGDQN